MANDLTFEQWYDIYSNKCRQLNWNGPIDKGSAKMDYDDGNTPEEAAREFVSEMNDVPDDSEVYPDGFIDVDAEDEDSNLYDDEFDEV